MTELVKQPPQTIWGKGQYQRIGSKLVIVAEQLCENINLKAGTKVLDVATGHGNAALAAARRECIVSGVDNVGELMTLGRQRASSEGLTVDYQSGDMQNLPFEAQTFDFVLSTFGAQFATDPVAAAKELKRVCRSGGKIGLTCWSPSGFTSKYNEVLARWMPKPPPSSVSPFIWGTAEGVERYLGDGINDLSLNKRTFTYRFAKVADWFDCFKSTYGPIMALAESLTADERHEMTIDVNAVVQQFNRSGDDSLMLPVDYLEVIAKRA